jgi:hypothetical protein
MNQEASMGALSWTFISQKLPQIQKTLPADLIANATAQLVIDAFSNDKAHGNSNSGKRRIDFIPN